MNSRSGRDAARLTVHGDARGVYATLLVASVFLFFALGYALQQARLPAAGATMVPNAGAAWRADGIEVRSLDEGQDLASTGGVGEGLKDGDLVVAIGGQSLSELAPRIAFGRSEPQWRVGDVVAFTVRRDGREMDVNVRLRRYPLLAAVSETWSIILFAVVTFFVGLFVFWRRPHLRAARILFLWGATLLSATTWALRLDMAQLANSSVFWLYTATACVAYVAFWSTGLHLSLIFPSPHPWLRGREGRAALVHLLVAVVTAAIVVSLLVRDEPLAWILAFLRAVDLVSLPTGALMILTLIWGYRRYYDADSRRRARIFLFTAITCGGTGIFVWNLMPLILERPIISAEVAGLLLIPAPLAMALSIVRHHLFDIDVIVRRTLIYTLLTAALALIYFGFVVLFQTLLGVFSGELSNLAIVLSTLAIAMLFSPLRRWIQQLIDRRFYRSKYDARETVTQFAQVARSEVDLDVLSAELVQLIRVTMQPSEVTLWLAKPGRAGSKQR